MIDLNDDKQQSLAIKRPVHGALDYVELSQLGLKPADMLDFSVNSNPYGPAPAVRKAIADAVIDRYPDRDCLQLRQSILSYELAGHKLPLASILCGNGASELIWSIAHAYLRPGKKAAIVGPAFGEYQAASQATGATIIEQRADAEQHFKPAISSLCTWIEAEQPTLVWLCNPNNPTGDLLTSLDVLRIVNTCRQSNSLLVIDESYRHFVMPRCAASAADLISSEEELPLIILRSLTKDFALAGLRLGYAVGAPSLLQRLSAQLPSWNVNSLAQLAGCAALADRAYLDTTLRMLADEREDFFDALRSSDLELVPSLTHFCLVKVDNARLVREKLLLKKIVVRDCTSFGLSQYIRVATRPAHEWSQLVLALQLIRNYECEALAVDVG